jgi:hypothetical protein
MEKIQLRLFEIMMGPPDAKGSFAHNVAAGKELTKILGGRAPDKKIVAHVHAGLDKDRLAEIRAIVLGVPKERVLEAGED